ncbi:hypothetical protein GCM10011396_05680 [Undibacterium terreum]|uniref:Uncharacterized protein n=1 Tax=Undibacterium terreum TaxID=1224302 RepID=A0A916U5Q7_9BURK|nr:hypothetical protein GCM10011396_05680 [Undibacterium terreum]
MPRKPSRKAILSACGVVIGGKLALRMEGFGLGNACMMPCCKGKIKQGLQIAGLFRHALSK